MRVIFCRTIFLDFVEKGKYNLTRLRNAFPF
nr:MAG TPA: hypothetical protein [Caudoviricetes sp.]